MAKVRLEYEVNTQDAKKAITDLNNAIKKTDQDRIASSKKREKEEQQAIERQKKSINGLKNELAELKREYNSLSKEQRESSQEGRRLEAEIAKLSGTIKRSTERIREQEKVNKSLLISQRQQVNSIKDLREFTNALVFQRDRLNLNSKESRRQFDLLTKQINQNNIALIRYDEQIRRSQRNVGNYAGAIKSVTLRLLAFVGGLSLVSRGLRSIISDFISFTSASAELQGISGATSEELKELNEQAKILGRTTASSATEVTKLQTELARLGFTANEILESTVAIQQFAIAIGGDLAKAAEVAGITLRQFGLDATEVQRIVDVASKSFSESPLTIDRFANSLRFAGTEARRAGFSIEETTAQVATLAEAGIFGTKSGRALRRIYLELGKSGVTGAEGLRILAREGLTVQDAFDEVGLSAQTALLILSEGIETTEEFTKSFENAAGAAERLAQIKLDTLEGDLKLLRSAVEGLNLEISGEGGLLRGLTQFGTFFVQLLTELFAKLQGLGKIIGSFVFTLQRDIENTFGGIFEALQSFAIATVNVFKNLGSGIKNILDAVLSGEDIKAAILNTVYSIEKEFDDFQKRGTERTKRRIEDDKKIWEDFGKDFVRINRETIARVNAAEKKAFEDREKIKQDETSKIEGQIQKLTNKEIEAITKANLEKLKLRDEADADILEREQARANKILEIREDLLAKTDEILDRELLSTKDKIELEFSARETQLKAEKRLLDKALEQGLQNDEEIIAAKKLLDEKIIALNEEKNIALATSNKKAIELNRELAIVTATGIGEVLGTIGQESEKLNEAIGEAIKKTLTSVIDAFLQAEIGKLTIQSFTTFGASLAAIGPTIAFAAAAKAAIGAIKFEEGGIPSQAKASRGTLLKGPSHAEGGIPIEAEGNEAIINKKSTKQFLPLLSAINSHNGNGVSFSSGESKYSGLLSKLDKGYKLGGIPKFANGGLPDVSAIRESNAGQQIAGILDNNLNKLSLDNIKVNTTVNQTGLTEFDVITEITRGQNRLVKNGVNISELQ